MFFNGTAYGNNDFQQNTADQGYATGQDQQPSAQLPAFVSIPQEEYDRYQQILTYNGTLTNQIGELRDVAKSLMEQQAKTNETLMSFAQNQYAMQQPYQQPQQDFGQAVTQDNFFDGLFTPPVTGGNSQMNLPQLPQVNTQAQLPQVSVQQPSVQDQFLELKRKEMINQQNLMSEVDSVYADFVANHKDLLPHEQKIRTAFLSKLQQKLVENPLAPPSVAKEVYNQTLREAQMWIQPGTQQQPGTAQPPQIPTGTSMQGYPQQPSQQQIQGLFGVNDNSYFTQQSADQRLAQSQQQRMDRFTRLKNTTVQM